MDDTHAVLSTCASTFSISAIPLRFSQQQRMGQIEQMSRSQCTIILNTQHIRVWHFGIFTIENLLYFETLHRLIHCLNNILHFLPWLNSNIIYALYASLQSCCWTLHSVLTCRQLKQLRTKSNLFYKRVEVQKYYAQCLYDRNSYTISVTEFPFLLTQNILLTYLWTQVMYTGKPASLLPPIMKMRK